MFYIIVFWVAFFLMVILSDSFKKSKKNTKVFTKPVDNYIQQEKTRNRNAKSEV